MSQREPVPDASQTSKACQDENVKHYPVSNATEASAPTPGDSAPNADQQKDESEESNTSTIKTEETGPGTKVEPEKLIVPSIEMRFCLVDGLQVASAHWHEYVVGHYIFKQLQGILHTAGYCVYCTDWCWCVSGG